MIVQLLIVNVVMIAGLVVIVLNSGAPTIVNVVFGGTVLLTATITIVLNHRCCWRTRRGFGRQGIVVFLAALAFMSGSAVRPTKYEPFSSGYKPFLVYLGANMVLSSGIAALALVLGRCTNIVQRYFSREQ